MDTQTLLLVAAGLAILALLVLLVMRRKPTALPAPAAQELAPPPADIPSPFIAEPDGAVDDLRKIKGIGPKLETQLHALGVFHFAQIAAWSPEQLAVVDAQLGAFSGRPERDQWLSQARLLAAGDIKAYERVHGKLGSSTPAADAAGSVA